MPGDGYLGIGIGGAGENKVEVVVVGSFWGGVDGREGKRLMPCRDAKIAIETRSPDFLKWNKILRVLRSADNVFQFMEILVREILVVLVEGAKKTTQTNMIFWVL